MHTCTCIIENQDYTSVMHVYVITIDHLTYSTLVYFYLSVRKVRHLLERVD